MQEILNQLRRMPATASRLERDSFEQHNGEAGTRSLIGSYRAPNPLVLRQNRPIRVIVTAFDSFTTDGNGNSQTFNLSHDLVESPQSQDLMLFADGNRAKPDSVDFAADSFDYTDGGAAEDLAAFYISGADCDFEIEKQAPSTQGSVSERIFEESLSLLHQRDQDEQARTFDLNASPLQPIVPRKWRLNVYAKGSYPVTWEDKDTGTTARNAVLSLPYKQGRNSVDGLSRAVAHDTVDRS
ncbi:major capsid protein PB2 [Saline Natrinema sp. J7-1 virus 1]|uniref:Major capsid protein PB2 n=1 Tax=Saline Natrinema sp. J7-1 virus 1 TaxID=2847285 RepID=A0AAF0AHL5_9VIRU|nr:major capsid protein PB2 [Saline Natrinema sp. J7-1 virus 1]WBE14031.1 major capsid protein PB2 [Saline Natrinema sp. J7-1 virus 1]